MSKKLPSKHFLRKLVSEALQEYFGKLEDGSVRDLYDFVLAEVEAPLLEQVMKHTEGNQCQAAICLGISRGTLRKLLSKYKLE